MAVSSSLRSSSSISAPILSSPRFDSAPPSTWCGSRRGDLTCSTRSSAPSAWASRAASATPLLDNAEPLVGTSIFRYMIGLPRV